MGKAEEFLKKKDELIKAVEFHKKKEELIKARKYNLIMKLKSLSAKFCEDNNPIKIGDIISDSQKTIKVTEINSCFDSFVCAVPNCVYKGVRVTKNGETWKESKKIETILQVKVKKINGENYDFRKEVDYVLS